VSGVWPPKFLSQGIAPEVDRAMAAGDFGGALRAFHAWQSGTWPQLRDALEGLGAVRTREVPLGGRPLTVQWNPGRRTSTTAKVDAASVRARPCFLCPDNLPSEEVGIPWGDDLVVLANPAPIGPLHLVIAHREHVPQRLDGVLQRTIAFARAAAGHLTVLYNGPTCGASAPDHLHLQAIEAGFTVDERIVTCRLAGCGREPVGRQLIARSGLHAWFNLESARSLFVFRGTSEAVEHGLRTALDVMADHLPGGVEPPVNLLVSAEGILVTALLYPRGGHRPACYSAEGDEQILISPGALDMGGVIITIREQDFVRVDTQLMETIFGETSLAAGPAEAIADELERRLNDE
jgi:hypothetical protein